MAAPGIFTSIKVEIQLLPGNWVDVSGDVALELGVEIQQGRVTESDDTAPGQLTFTLRNDTGRYTPNNPTGPYFPYVTEGRPVRMSVIKSAVTYRRFTGEISVLEPVFPDDNSSTGQVKITAIDVLATLQNRLTQSGHVEEAIRIARLQASWADVYTFEKAPRSSSRAPQYFTNFGITASGGTLGHSVIMGSGHGTTALGSPGGLITDASLDFKPRAKYAVGPVLKCVIGTADQNVAPLPQRIEWWMSVDTSFQSGGNTYYVCHLWNIIGGIAELFSVRIFQAGDLTMHIGIYNAAGTHILDFNDEDGNTFSSANDGNWHKYTIYWDGTKTHFVMDDLYTVDVSTAALNVTQADRVYFGGGMKPGKEHGAYWCPPVSMAAISITGATAGVPAEFVNGAASLTDAETRYYELCGYTDTLFTQRYATGTTYTAASTTLTVSSAQFSSDDVGAGVGANTTDIPANAVISAYVSPTQVTLSRPATVSGSTSLLIGPVQIGTDVRPVARINVKDSANLQEAFAALARTWGGAMWADVNGQPLLIHPDGINPIAALATLDLEGDIEASDLTLRRAIDTVPTRVAVSGPIGDVTFIDTATEAGFYTGQAYRKDDSVNAGVANDSDGYSLGGFYATQSHGLRIVKIDLDLVTAATDLYSTLLTAGNLRPGVRLRGAGLPTAIFGTTTSDVVVQGWRETYDPVSALFSFDLTPADDPIQGVWDDSTNGRWSAGLRGLQLGYPVVSAFLTLVVAPGDNSGIALTTVSGDYPLDLDIQGERVTVASAPGASTTRTNLCTNPSFDTNTTGWAGGGTAPTLAQVPSPAIGATPPPLHAMRVTWPTASANASTVGYSATGLTIGHTYAFSGYIFVPAGSPRVVAADISGTMTGFAAQPLPDTTGFNGAFVRIGFTAVASATSHTVGFKNLDASTSGQVCYADAVLLEDTTLGVGSYFDGDIAGTWTGTVGASTSTQQIQTVTVTRGIAPTLARAHIAGEVVDIYHAMTWTI